MAMLYKLAAATYNMQRRIPFVKSSLSLIVPTTKDEIEKTGKEKIKLLA
jgi:hypothetical protein